MSIGAKWFIGGILFMLFVVAALGFGYWYGQKKADETKPSATPTQTATLTASPTASPTSTKEGDGYTGWKTYSNKDIGYTLKYPSDWMLKEINTYNETIQKDVKYVTVTTPNEKYFLHFGLKKKTDGSYEISDRTGMGAGEIKKTGSKITILDTGVDIESFVYQNKIKEFFYPQKATTTTDGKWQFTATFSYTDKVNYDTLDMTGLEEEKNAEKILESIDLL